MATLTELSKSKNEKTRLQAAMRMSDILLAHQEAEQRVAIAAARAAARKAEAASSAACGSTAAMAETPASHQDAANRARAFLASLDADKKGVTLDE